LRVAFALETGISEGRNLTSRVYRLLAVIAGDSLC
jgi:hypothetical protein